MREMMKLLTLVLAVAPGAVAYESAFPRTEVGVAEVKEIAATKVLVASVDGEYFANSNALFRRPPLP